MLADVVQPCSYCLAVLHTVSLPRSLSSPSLFVNPLADVVTFWESAPVYPSDSVTDFKASVLNSASNAVIGASAAEGKQNAPGFSTR